MGQKDKRSELLEEYYKLAAIVQGYDSYFLSIKAWDLSRTPRLCMLESTRPQGCYAKAYSFDESR